jgi:RNA recognition motif-containing protein
MDTCVVAGTQEAEYKAFLAEMGGAPPQEAGGHHSDSRPGGGGGGRSRPGDDLPDNCKLYVGNLAPEVTDSVLKTLMQPFGNVLHAVVLLDMTTGESCMAAYGTCLENPSFEDPWNL